MKKILATGFSIFLSAGIIFAASFKKGSTVYVNVKSAAVKSGTGFFAKSTGTVSYGDSLIVLQGNDKKTQVKTSSNLTGWVANGSLTSKKIMMAGSGNTASKSELALAGKGFSAEAENAFKASDSKLNYAAVDAIEKISVSEAEVLLFAKEGKLAGGEE